MKFLFALAVLCLGYFVMASCESSESGRRLRLPPGNAERGRVAFVTLGCTECHTVVGVDLPRPNIDASDVVQLGGSVPRVHTVGDLLTAIIHPSASVALKLKRKPIGPGGALAMPSKGDEMTVKQMVDLVRFLQPRYSRMPPPLDWPLPR
jgi:hypothetical protein